MSEPEPQSGTAEYRDIDETLLDEMADLDVNRSTRGARGDAFFCNPANWEFMRALVRRLRRRDMLRMVALQDRNRMLPFELSFHYDRRNFAYQASFDKALSNLGLGNLAYIESVRRAIEQDSKEYDFLVGDDDYKQKWCRHWRRARSLRAYRPSLSTMPAQAYHRWVKPIRRRLGESRLAKAVPARIRRRLDL